MRNLPSPDFYGDVARRFVLYHLFLTMDNIPSISGPFRNEQDFNMGLVGKLRRIGEENRRYSYKSDFYDRNVSPLFSNHPATFSHSDVQRKNIKSPDPEKDFEVAIDDWGSAGWYPSYWESAS